MIFHYFCFKGQSQCLKFGEWEIHPGVYGPEVLIKMTDFWTNIFLESEMYSKRISLISIDEVHIIDTL